VGRARRVQVPMRTGVLGRRVGMVRMLLERDLGVLIRFPGDLVSPWCRGSIGHALDRGQTCPPSSAATKRWPLTASWATFGRDACAPAAKTREALAGEVVNEADAS
jgi:hypothetical protein